jgi:hypothetical protein
MSELGIDAVNCVLLLKVVETVMVAEPTHATIHPLAKFVPLTVSIKPAPPALVLVGEMEVIVGFAGLVVSASAGMESRMATVTKLHLDFDTAPPTQNRAYNRRL